MPPNDAVPQAGPTCPLSDEELIARYRGTEGAFLLPDLHETVLAVVAAERARLRKELEKERSWDDDYALEQFDEACRTVDATTRRA